MDVHLWHVPQWETETETHDCVVELQASLLHSREFDDLTGGILVNFSVFLLPKKPEDRWRRAIVSLPSAELGQRIVDLYGVGGPLRYPHNIKVQAHVGMSQPALWERLRTSIYVPPAVKKGDGPEGRAIPVTHLGYGRIIELTEDHARWSEECARSGDIPSCVLFDDREDRLRVESPGQPAIILDVRNIRAAIIDVDVHSALVIFFLSRPAPLLLVKSDDEIDVPPAELVYGNRPNAVYLATRHSDLGGEHADMAGYVSTELCLVIPRHDWLRFEASAAEIGLPEPFKRVITVDRLGLYNPDTLCRLDRTIANASLVAIAVQLDALVKNGALTPAQVIELASDTSRALRAGIEREQIVAALVELGTKLLPRLLLYDGDTLQLNDKDWRAEWKGCLAVDHPLRIDDDTTVSTCRAFVTPTSVRIDGPFLGVTNRILRTYGHSDHFLRVAFVDEDESPFSPSREVDVDRFIAARFRPFLYDGLVIGGRHFSLLAFSMSSLREHSAWFVTPFLAPDGQIVTADSIRRDVGDLGQISRLPARFAARLSQTLTGTECAVPLSPDWIVDVPDLKAASGEDFTDGIGLMSTEVARRIHDRLPFLHPHRSQDRAPLASVQIRLGGCKGMLSLDPSLEGSRVLLRPSMRKFVAEERTLEVARTFREPMAYHLNRPLVQILEGLGVSADRFLELQSTANGWIESAVGSSKAAGAFVSSYSFGEAFWLSRLFYHISATLKLPMTAHRDDAFLARVLDAAIHIAKRDLKHRARIPVAGSWTLVGVADVHGQLEEGEIYACIVEPNTGLKTWLQGRIAVSRSPTEHPGDVQTARAVGCMPAAHRKMYDPLVNVVVFASKGRRPLPAQLAGGDLDGDIFNLLLDATLHPIFTVNPSPPGTSNGLDPLKISHPCGGEDIADWFVDFMQHDNLGVISSLRLALADYLQPDGPLHGDCIRLAELASAAVDYRKTGACIPRDWLPIPPAKKPDFMRAEGAALQPAAYYRSEMALGQLYRAIELPPSPPGNDPTDVTGSKLICDAIEAACAAVGVTPAVLHDASFAPALLAAYASALRRICSAQTPALTEAEAVVGRAIAPLPAQDPRRRAAMAREVEAGTGALTTWARRKIGRAEVAMAVWQYARTEGTRWGARSLGWLAVGIVLDKVAELRAFIGSDLLRWCDTLSRSDAEQLGKSGKAFLAGKL